MNKLEDFNKIIIKNNENKFIVEEFIQYFMYIYTSFVTNKKLKNIEEKSSKENYYKLVAIKKTINIVANLKKKLESGEELNTIKGIGPKTIARLNEIIKTGYLAEIKDYKEKNTNIVSELSNIYGIGPTKASYYYNKFNINTIKDFIEKINNGEIKITNQIKIGLEYYDKLSTKIPRIVIARLENYIYNTIHNIDKDFLSVICGSFRREKDFSSDVDILITHKKIISNKKYTGCPADLCQHYLHKIVTELKKTFIIPTADLTTNYSTHFQGFGNFKHINDLPNIQMNEFNYNSVIRVDIIIVPSDDFYSALLHFTGSGDFNQKLRIQAKAMDMKLNEYGLFKKIKNKYLKIKIDSEADIFKELLLKYIPPNKR